MSGSGKKPVDNTKDALAKLTRGYEQYAETNRNTDYTARRVIKKPVMASTHALVYTIGVDVLPHYIHDHMTDIVSQTGKQPLFILFGKDRSLESLSSVLVRGIDVKTVCAWYTVPNANKLVYIFKE